MLDCVTAETLCPPCPNPRRSPNSDFGLCDGPVALLTPSRALAEAAPRRAKTLREKRPLEDSPHRVGPAPRANPKGFRDHPPEVFRRRGACVKTAKRNGSQVFENKQSREITDSAPLMISMAYYEECEAFRFALRNDFRIFAAARRQRSLQRRRSSPSRGRSAAKKPSIAHRLSMPVAPRHCRPQQRKVAQKST